MLGRKSLPSQLINQVVAEKNECLGTHCSLIAKKIEKSIPIPCARKFEVKVKTKDRTVEQGRSESLRGKEEKWPIC